MLSFQHLDVYECSIRFLASSMRLVGSLPKGNAKLADQLRRAALSIPSRWLPSSVDEPAPRRRRRRRRRSRKRQRRRYTCRSRLANHTPRR